MKIKCKYEKLININEIKHNPFNPNAHSTEQIKRLAEIIKYQGIRLPVIISSLSNLVVAGHGRLEAYRLLGIKEVPCDIQEFQDTDQENAFMASDNAIASWAELDLAIVNSFVPDLDPSFDVNLFGINGFTLDVAEHEPTDNRLTTIEEEKATCPECGHEFNV